MFKSIVMRVMSSSKVETEVVEIDSKSVVLEALCAYRDDLIMSDDYGTLENHMKLLCLHAEINELLANRVK